MKYSREYLERLGGRTGFRPDMLEKVLRLERILDQVKRHPFVGPRLVLKGGTALNLFYGRAPRLSVDLDFNYVGALDREDMLRERPEVERGVEQIAAGEGYTIQRAAEEHAGRKFYLNYWNGLGTQDRIEVDLNYMFRIPLVPFTLQDGWTPDPDFPCRARMVGIEEVMAGKLVAMTDRTAPRDLYDVASFVANSPAHDREMLRCLFIVLSGTLPRALTEYSVDRLRTFAQQDFDDQLAPMLRLDERPRLEELKARVAPLLERLFNLSPDERRYVERLQWGEFLPERVAGDRADLLDRLRRHPALLWKVENARRRTS